MQIISLASLVFPLLSIPLWSDQTFTFNCDTSSEVCNNVKPSIWSTIAVILGSAAAAEPGVGRGSALYQRLAQTGTALDMLIEEHSVDALLYYGAVVWIAYRTDCLAATEVEVINLEEKRSYQKLEMLDSWWHIWHFARKSWHPEAQANGIHVFLHYLAIHSVYVYLPYWTNSCIKGRGVEKAKDV